MYTEECIKTFLKNQGQLFDEPVAETFEEAEEFLEDCMAVVADSIEDVQKYLSGMGADVEGMSKEELLELLKEVVAKNEIDIDEKVLRDVYLAACKAYEGKKRYSGEEYVTHPINVAILLAELGAEHDAVLAGMFCDVTTKGNDIELENELPVNVWNIVKQLEEKESNEAILIKLAERLHNMRTIDFIDESKKAIKAKETIEIYMPLARKINNQKLTDELNNLAFKYNV